MDKSELYTAIIDTQKKTGQGTAGIITVMGTNASKFRTYIDEFIEEGLIVCCDTGGSMGHPESNKFYMPVKGYNVWLDEGDKDDGYSKYKGRFLTYVRFYLGALEAERKITGDENLDNNRRILNPSMTDIRQSAANMEGYSKWLKRNEEALEVMKNLDDYYEAKVIKFTKKEKEHVKTKTWYKNNVTIKECHLKSDTAVLERNESIKIQNQLISLYDKDKKYAKDLKEAEKGIEKDKKEILFRKKLHRWFDDQDQDTKIQSLWKKVE